MIKRVVVGNNTYTVEEWKEDRRNDSNTGLLLGEIDHLALTIGVLGRMDERVKRVILIHEMLHAISWQTGLYLDDETEERVVIAFSNALLQVIEENPALIRYLRQGEKKNSP
jgi:hypothetical protein